MSKLRRRQDWQSVVLFYDSTTLCQNIGEQRGRTIEFARVLSAEEDANVKLLLLYFQLHIYLFNASHTKINLLEMMID